MGYCSTRFSGSGECNLQAPQTDLSTVGRLGHESRLEMILDMPPPGTRCGAIDVTYRVLDFSSEGGKTTCACASCLPTGCVSNYTVAVVGQSSDVLEDIRLRCRLSCNRVCCSSCSRFFVGLAIGAATGDAKGYRGMPRCRSQYREKVPDGRCHPWLCSGVCWNVSMSLCSGLACDIIYAAR